MINRITNHEWKWGKRNVSDNASFFLLIYSITENRHELVELAQLFRMVWKVGKVVNGVERSTRERSCRARIAHVHEAGTRRRERSRNAGRRLGVCAVNEEGGGSRPR